MVSLRCSLVLVALGAVTSSIMASTAEPVAEVLTLLEELKTKVEKEGATEAASYDKFACFCKDTTESRSNSIKESQDKIDSLAASIQDGVATTQEKASEQLDRKKKNEEVQAQLADTVARCQTENAEFDANFADLSKAVTSLEGAIQALEAKKNQASFLAVKASVAETLALANALSLLDMPRQRAANAFLQQKVDPSDPEYKFQSEGIIDTLKTLLKEFSAKKDTEQSEWDKAKESCSMMKSGMTDELEANSNAIESLEEELGSLKSNIAEDRESLVETEDVLKEDKKYLKELTTQCETAAVTWDQRSQTRKDEIKALGEAVAILKDEVAGADEAVNKRALLLERNQSPTPQAAERPIRRARAASFMQVSSMRSAEGLQHIMTKLQEDADRLQSGLLKDLGLRAAGAPFDKVKTLIQQLIERLLEESRQEATKQGFCNEELGKATTERDARKSDVEKLSADIEVLTAKSHALVEDMEELSEEVDKLNSSLVEASTLRAEEKESNIKTLEDAKQGLAALDKAIAVLKNFYSSAAKAAFAQVQETPEPEGPGFEGAYKGQQESSTGIFGLLEVIRSDFERTIRMTQASEKKAQEEFVEFDQESRSNKAGKETSMELDGEDLAAVKTAVERKTRDLEAAQDLLDAALKTIEDLKPMCIDHGMSYEERVEKRDEEIAALKTALCHLDPDQVEAECK